MMTRGRALLWCVCVCVCVSVSSFVQYNVSPLGDFHMPLRALCELAALPAAAAAMTRHPAWLPRSINGRAFENECLLGYAFRRDQTLSLSLAPASGWDERQTSCKSAWGNSRSPVLRR
jgi:hypothetical protein